MTARLSPARIRAGQRMLAYYREAGAHVLAEEEAADTLLVSTLDDLLAARFRDLATDPDGFTAYLDGLELSHGHDPAMRVFIDRSRARLAAFTDDSEHPDSAPDGDPATTPDGPDHTAPADLEVAAHG